MSFQEAYAESCKHRLKTGRCGLKVGSWPDDCRESACPTVPEYRRGLREGWSACAQFVFETYSRMDDDQRDFIVTEGARRWPGGDE